MKDTDGGQAKGFEGIQKEGRDRERGNSACGIRRLKLARKGDREGKTMSCGQARTVTG